MGLKCLWNSHLARRQLALQLRCRRQGTSVLCGVSLLFSRRVLVAFDTGRGLVYTPASGWARVYLLWTFRNFRSLPQKVLNPRQQELITTLYRTATQKAPRLFEDTLIGTVEGFIPPVRVTATQLVPEIPSSNTAVVGTVGRGKRVFNFDFAFDRLSFPQLEFARVVPSRITLQVGTGALAAIVAVLGWRQSRNQPVLAHWASVGGTVRAASAAQRSDPSIPEEVSQTTVQSPPDAEAQPPSAPQAAVSQVPINQVASPEASATPLRMALAPEPATSEQSASAPIVNRLDATLVIPRRANFSVTHAVTPPTHQALTPETPAESARVQISGPPRKLVYPVCPSTNARGNVSLHAVVGSDGAVSQVKVVRGDRTLAAAAVEAVRQWRYQPSTGDMSRSERETNITVSFVSGEVVAVSFPDSAISR